MTRGLKNDIYTSILPLSFSDGGYCYQFSRRELFSGTNFCKLGTDVIIFITFRVHQVQIKKLTLNRNKTNRVGSGVPRWLKRDI